MKTIALRATLFLLICSFMPWAIAIDGNDADWADLGSNKWFDTGNDAGGGSRDFTKIMLSSDATNLYLYVKFAAQYGNDAYPEINLQIDKDALSRTGLAGYDSKLIIGAASSSGPCPSGCVRKIQYDSAGAVIGDLWLASGWMPNTPNHGKDFLEISIPLAALNLAPSSAFRYFISSRQFWAGSGGDYLGENNDPLSSALRYYPASHPFATARSMQVDGVDLDWRLRQTLIHDVPGDAGGGTRDLLSAGVFTDQNNLYFNARFQAPYGAGPYPEATLFIDKDLNASTGSSGYEIAINIAGASSDGPCSGGCVKRTLYASNGSVVSSQYVSTPIQPNYPGHGLDFLETSLSLADLGLASTPRFRYMLYSRQFYVGSGGDYLRGYNTIAGSSLYYTHAEKLAIDGLEDDWKSIRTDWPDPKGDVTGASRDITGFALSSDASKLYAKVAMGTDFSAAEYPEVQICLDKDRNASTGLNGCDARLIVAGAGASSPCTGGCIQRILYNSSGVVTNSVWLSDGWMPNTSSHSLDFIEFSASLSDLGLTASQVFRFSVYSRQFSNGTGGDYLQGQSSIASSRLEYPKEILQLGVLASLNAADLKEIKDTLLAGQTFKKGKYFDTRLSVHADIELDLQHTATINAQNVVSYDFTSFNSTMAVIKASGLAFAPLINFHYLPGWFESKNLSVFGKDPRVRDASGNPAGWMFMPYLPYCDGYMVWGRDMSIKAAQEIKKYQGDQILEVTIGNEASYANKNTGYDASYTLPLWQAEHPGQPVPQPADAIFKQFRSRLMMDALGKWMDAPAEEFKGRIPVSTKTVPYYFSNGYYQEAGYFPHVYDYFNNPKRPVSGMDSYPLDKLNMQSTFRIDKSTSIFEYGGGTQNSATTPNRYEMADWLVEGVNRLNVRSAYCYQWPNAGDVPYYMKSEQKSGLKMAIEELAVADKPVAKVYSVKTLLPVQNLASNSPNHWGLLEGLKKAAYLVHAQFPEIGVELDYSLKGSAPDLVIRPVFGNSAIPSEEVFDKSNIYLLYGAGTQISFGSYQVSTGGNASNSLSKLVSNNFSLPLNATIMNWTQEWANGNKNLATNLPTSGAQSYTSLVTSGGGHPTVIKVGKSVFISSDIAWAIQSDGYGGQFLAEVIKKLLYGEI